MQLSTELLLAAYCEGMFPMAHEDGHVYWYDPDPRAILPLDEFHIPSRLARTIRSVQFDASTDSVFDEVIEACAAPTPEREETWLNDELIRAYKALHRAGLAHSVEVWSEDQLIGGLYGVAIRGLFAGESMFSRVANASKVALVYLVDRLRDKGYQLLDVQFLTEHLRQFGAIEISRGEYQRRLALALSASVHPWAEDHGRSALSAARLWCGDKMVRLRKIGEGNRNEIT